VTAYNLLSLGINSQLVLQNIKLTLIDQVLIGNVRLRIPYSNEYYWTGTLSSDKTNYLIRIREMIKSSPLKPDTAMRIFLLPHSPPETEQIQFSQLNQFLGEFPNRDFASKKERLELLKGIKLNLIIEIGQIKLKISDIMKLNPDQIIKIGKQLPQKVNLTIENQLIASGILFSSAEDLIIKITEIQD
jgi:flagellar motor switch protein FliN/FliY